MKSLSCSSFLQTLSRRKPLETVSHVTPLNRCLTTFELTFLGVGSTIGLGLYVLAGVVASTEAGPGIVVSFLLAGTTSVFAALCYAEFGSLVPKAGSAYVYSYISVGELMAFIIGWDLILEYLIGTASVARGYSAYIDFLVKDTGWSFRNVFENNMPMNVSQLSSYPDFLAFIISMSLAIGLCFGVNHSARFTAIFTIMNLFIVVLVLVDGGIKADLRNWSLSYDSVPHKNCSTRNSIEGGSGGFFPFGMKGVTEGAATCFYAYIGFDTICGAAEEAANPRKSVPRAIFWCLVIATAAYVGVSMVQTLMWPYYDQNNEAPLPYIFEQYEEPIMKWIVSIGALFALSTNILGNMFPLPRILYAMASDGLIFRFLSSVSQRFQTPMIATLLAGFLNGILAAIFDVKQLADMMSIGTLMGYSLVAGSVLFLRYSLNSPIDVNVDEPSEDLQEFVNFGSCRELFALMLNSKKLKTPTSTTKKFSAGLILASSFLVVVIVGLAVFYQNDISEGDVIVVTFFSLSWIFLAMTLTMLWRQPLNPERDSFQVPLVPLTPIISIGFNVYLMMNLSEATWIRYAIWFVVGMVIYALYGARNSTGYLAQHNVVDEQHDNLCQHDYNEVNS